MIARQEDSQRSEGRPPVSDRTMNIEQLRQRIERHEYAVDPRVVAEAIVARMCGVAARPEPPPPNH
jgi:anti-sigma28 factor (negative regulator of flagellin synthesis)